MKNFNLKSPERNPANPAAWGQALREASAELQIFLSDAQVNRFLLYYRELAFWNSKFNLIASAESPQEIFLRHFLDSLTLIPCLPLPDGRLIDIGTGGGFPGIPLKITLNRLQVTLVEASRKKASFLKSLRRLLDLGELEVLQERVENLAERDAFRHGFDMVVSRAALKLPEYLRWGKELMTPEGVIIAMKGANYSRELEEVQGQLADWGLALAEERRLTLPLAGDSRVLLIFRKSIS